MGIIFSSTIVDYEICGENDNHNLDIFLRQEKTHKYICTISIEQSYKTTYMYNMFNGGSINDNNKRVSRKYMGYLIKEEIIFGNLLRSQF